MLSSKQEGIAVSFVKKAMTDTLDKIQLNHCCLVPTGQLLNASSHAPVMWLIVVIHRIYQLCQKVIILLESTNRVCKGSLYIDTVEPSMISTASMGVVSMLMLFCTTVKLLLYGKIGHYKYYNNFHMNERSKIK